ncbi:hypothetical protein [Acidocella sp.]|uniref:hypothetical protein n=1 Tax=Acidocella sp. TaxID=50710 RepID=UPI00262542EE|nr:hypothetical protein [Acidocella sp.]
MTAPLGSGAPEFPPEFMEVAAGLTVPAALQPSIERHRAHLAQLILSLRAAFVPEAQIEASIRTLSASYRAELIQVLKSLMKDDHAPD